MLNVCDFYSIIEVNFCLVFRGFFLSELVLAIIDNSFSYKPTLNGIKTFNCLNPQTKT